MGVRGMQSWLKANKSSLGKCHNLNDIVVIVDANNLFCFIYTNLCLTSPRFFRNDIYNGDMVALAKAIKDFFNALELCNITPILIFDGSVVGKQSTTEQVALKTETLIKRAMERFSYVRDLSEDTTDTNLIIIPTTVGQVFRNIVKQLNIQTVQSPYEADGHIARMANDLNCLVLTNDSDFLIYDLPQGFIMLDMFDFSNFIKLPSGKKAIKGIVYSQTQLVSFFPGLTKASMPLLSMFLGNDYVDAKIFKPLFDAITRSYSGSLEVNSFSHRKIVSMLTWLKDYSFNDSIKEILNKIPPSSQEYANGVIKMLLKSYNIERPEDLQQELTAIYPPKGSVYPSSYLANIVSSGSVPSITLDIIFGNECNNYPIIEDWDQQSTSVIKKRPISVALSLLKAKSYQDMTANQRKIEFVLYDRVHNSYDKTYITPCERLENFGSLNGVTLYSIVEASTDDKKQIMIDTFRMRRERMTVIFENVEKVFDKNLSNDLSILMLLLDFIGIETGRPIDRNFKFSLINTIFFYASFDGFLNQDNISAQHVNVANYLLKLNPHSIKENSKKYSNYSSNSYRKIMHTISQLHHVNEMYKMVNGILGNIFPVLRPELYFNGTLLLRLTRLFGSGELTIRNISEQIPLLGSLCLTTA